MILNAGNILLIGSILLFVSIVVGKAGFRFGVPALLLFLGVGMLFGTDGLGIEFNNPQTAQFIGVIALSIILFSGGMDTSAAEIKPVLGQGIVLATVGGLTINANAQVVDTSGNPIPGLYATGNASGSFYSGNYPRHIPGTSVGRAATFGYVAADHMVNGGQA